LADAYPDHAVSVQQVGQRQKISAKYLEHILKALKAAGLVQAVHGKHGGYVLTRSPGRITLKEVYGSLAGSLAPVHCLDDTDSCPMRDVCPTWDTWAEVEEAVEKVLERTTVQDLAERKRRKSVSSGPMYYV